MTLWPRDNAFLNEQLESQMQVAKDVIECMNALRQDQKLKLKWPLDSVTIAPAEKRFEDALRNLAPVIRFMGNVKEVKFGKVPGMNDYAFGRMALGQVVKEEAMLREVVRLVQVLRKKEKLNVQDSIKLWITSDNETLDLLKPMSRELSLGVGAKEITFGRMENQKGSDTIQDHTVNVGFRK